VRLDLRPKQKMLEILIALGLDGGDATGEHLRAIGVAAREQRQERHRFILP
jgi:hypothetical protein